MLYFLCFALVTEIVTAYTPIHIYKSTPFHQDNSSSPQTSPHGLAYGDMALTKMQEFVFKQNRKGFNGIPDPTRRWKDAIIPYKIDCSLENLKEAKVAIKNAMAEWERKTCIRFVKHTKEKYFLKFFRDTHCWGNVGQIEYARISVGNGCEYNYVMAHEIGHAVGLYHEHNRQDRDNWVRVNWENIGKFRDAFAIQHVSESYGVSYDYESIMHYPWSAFSINGKDTMAPKKSRGGKVPYVEISRNDIKLVSIMYNCPAIERKRQRRRKRSIEKNDQGCYDRQKKCPTWKKWGHCTYKWVRTYHCRKTCNECSGGKIITEAPATLNPATLNPATLNPVTLNPGTLNPGTLNPGTLNPGTPPPSVKKGFKWDTWPNRNIVGTGRRCIDMNVKCGKWAKMGECKANPGYMLRSCMKSCKNLGFEIECDGKIATPGGACSQPLGVGLNADGSRTLPDSAFSSSDTMIAGSWEAPAYSARLSNEDDYRKRKIGSWCAEAGSTKIRWVQVDLGRIKKVTYIATQGRPKYYERTSQFKIMYSNTPNSNAFKTFQENGKDKIFYGNCDHTTPVLNRFKNPISARYLRYIPWRWNFPCVRMEFYGC